MEFWENEVYRADPYHSIRPSTIGEGYFSFYYLVKKYLIHDIVNDIVNDCIII